VCLKMGPKHSKMGPKHSKTGRKHLKTGCIKHWKTGKTWLCV